MVQGERMRIHQKEEKFIASRDVLMSFEDGSTSWVRQRDMKVSRRLVPCPLGCERDIVFEELEVHKCKEVRNVRFPFWSVVTVVVFFEGDWAMATYSNGEVDSRG